MQKLTELNPFKGLRPYQFEDKDKLFGRDRDFALLENRIFSGRVTLLFSASGIGKTSFLTAKFIPDFDSDYLICYFKDWSSESFKQNLIREIIKSFNIFDEIDKKKIENKKNIKFDDIIQVYKYYRPYNVILILDQFEELFRHHRKSEYFVDFIDSLCSLINAYKDVDIKIIFSIREDFLAELNIFGSKILDPYQNYYRLEKPDGEQVKEIIKKTVSKLKDEITKSEYDIITKRVIASIEISEINLSKLIEDLSVSNYYPSNVVSLPFLQLVCYQLWEEEVISRIKKILIKGEGEETVQNLAFLGSYRNRIIEENNSKIKDAEFIKKQYCYQQLDKCFGWKNFITRIKAIKIFDHLVSPEMVSRPIEIGHLSSLLHTKKESIKKVTAKLEEVSIVKKVIEHNIEGKQWIELYPDMFDRIIFDWKEQIRSRIRKTFLAFGFIFIVIMVTSIYLFWIFKQTADKNIDVVNYSLVEIMTSTDIDAFEKYKIFREVTNFSEMKEIRSDFTRLKKVEDIEIAKLKFSIQYKAEEKMVFIPKSKFIYGGFVETNDDFLGEDTFHEINLPSFYIDKYPVSNKEYGEFLEATGGGQHGPYCHPDENKYLKPNHIPKFWNESQYKQYSPNPEDPIIYIDWYDAYAYANWAGKRLPTEEEWEKAARGLYGRRYPWGYLMSSDEIIPQIFQTNEKLLEIPSPFGCYHMVGKVWQWTNSYEELEKRYTIRGAPFRGDQLKDAFVMMRSKFYPGYSNYDIGFRCAKDVSDSSKTTNR